MAPGESDRHADPSAEAAPTPGAAVRACYRCGTALEDGDRHCPRCGRPQYRVCFCGSHIPITARTCPTCSADWSQAARVRHRQRRTHLDRNMMGKYALVGALAALIVAAVGDHLMLGYAAAVLPPGQDVPDGFATQWALARRGFALALSHAEKRAGDSLTAMAPLFALIVAGALLGALIYLWRKGALLSWPHRRRGSRTRKERSGKPS